MIFTESMCVCVLVCAGGCSVVSGSVCSHPAAAAVPGGCLWQTGCRSRSHQTARESQIHRPCPNICCMTQHDRFRLEIDFAKCWTSRSTVSCSHPSCWQVDFILQPLLSRHSASWTCDPGVDSAKSWALLISLRLSRDGEWSSDRCLTRYCDRF